MDECISREAIVNKIKSHISTAEDAWESGYNTAMAEVMEWIKNIPTAADAQNVRREYKCNWSIPIIKINTFCTINKVNCGSEKCPAWNYDDCGDCYFHIKSPCDWNWNIIKNIIQKKG